MSQVKELLEVAVTVAEKAGDLIATRRAGHVEVASTKSSINDVVTQVDTDAELLIHELLDTLRPGDGFLGEEGGTGESKSGVTWVVDPIDGTVNFLYGIPHYAVSIAAIEGPPHPEEWTVLAGVVFNPAIGQMFTAQLGGGAFEGKKPMRVAEPVDLTNALLLTGFAYAEQYRRAQGELVSKLLPMVRDIRRMGTASLDLAMIASGRGNIFFERTLSPWDHAAGDLLVSEAGGVVRGFGDDAPTREAAIAGHADMVRNLQRTIADLGGDQPLSSYL